MSRFNTGNPLGSGSPLDLDDNAKNLDEAMNSNEAAWTDRFGRPRRSMAGVDVAVEMVEDAAEEAVEQAIPGIVAAVDADAKEHLAVAESSWEGRFQAGQDLRNSRFEEFIAASGYQFVGDYAAGIELTEYNQIVRDADGEFWRVSGSTELPYTTTGAGLPEGGAFVPVGDAALRQQLAGPAGYRLVSDQMAANAYGVPGKLERVVVSQGDIQPADFFHDYFWGRESGTQNIFRSKDGGEWEFYANSTHTLWHRIMPTSDGEVLTINQGGVRKSTGWGTPGLTWATVLENTSPGSDVPFLRWGVDGDGQKFIINHYGAGSSTWAESRYVWISLDAGSSWTVVWDKEDLFPDDMAGSHLHAVCYDKWEDRFYFCEGHGTPHGVYYSDDDGVNWTRINHPAIASPSYTTMVATDFGIVCGTDSQVAGIFVIKRGNTSADDFVVEHFGEWKTVAPHFTGLWGFADRGFRDPDTGIVYTSFFSQSPNAHCVIMACGAMGASVVYEGPVEKRISNVVAAKGVLLAVTNFTEGNVLRAVTSRYGSPVGDAFIDLGQILTDTPALLGVAVGKDSRLVGARQMAIGLSARAGSSNLQERCIAIGHFSEGTTSSVVIGESAKSSSTQSVVIGQGLINNAARSVNIGFETDAGSDIDTVCVGYGTKTTGGQTVAIGSQAKGIGYQAVAIGRNATAAGGGVAIGAQSEASASSIALRGQATGANSVSIGNNAVAAFSNSIALRSTSTASGQLSLGGKHISLLNVATPSTGQGASEIRLYVRLNNDNKQELCVRFGDGSVVPLAVSP